MTINEINTIINGKIIGNADLNIKGIGDINSHKKDDIIVISNKTALKKTQITSKAIVIPETLLYDKPSNITAIIVYDPKIALVKLLKLFKLENNVYTTGKYSAHPTAEIEKSATIGDYCVIGENCSIGKNTTIYPNCSIGSNVIIGENCLIKYGVKIEENSQIGNNAIISSGAVIGGDGFGYYATENQIIKLEHIGKVLIENDVEIGSNTTIDKATISETVIGEGTKIDNLVQIAHNVKIGKRCRIAGLTAIAGSVIIGDDCLIAGQVGIKEHTKIASNTIIGGKSGVTKDIKKSGNYVLGFPAQTFSLESKEKASIKMLPKFFKKLRKLEKLFKKADSK